MTKRICVTGASGRAGRVTVAELLAHGYEVVATDQVRPPHDLGTGVLLADLTEYGQAVEVLAGTDAVVHLANIPAPEIRTPATTFNANMTMNFNVFLAAAQARLERVVWASSETTLGLPMGCPRSPARPSLPTSPAGPASRSSRCGSPTSSARRNTKASPPTGRTRGRASGTCGATSTSGTRRRRAGWRWRRRPKAARATSSPRQTR